MRREEVFKEAQDIILGLIADSDLRLRVCGNILALCKKELDSTVPYAAVSFDTAHKVFKLHIGAYIGELTHEQKRFLFVHEAMHICNMHIARTKDGMDHLISNIAQDCIINSTILGWNIDSLQFIEGGCLMPPEYKGSWLFEELYHYLLKDSDKEIDEQSDSGSSESSDSTSSSNSNSNQSNSNQSASSSSSDSSSSSSDSSPNSNNSPKPNPSRLGKGIKGVGRLIDTHMENMGEAERAIAEAVAEALLRKAAAAVGCGSGIVGELKLAHIERGKWARKIKSLLRESLSSKEREETWGRPNRRALSLPGYYRNDKKVAIVLDTSGSMSEDDFIKTLSQIYISGIEYHVYYVDTQILRCEKVRDIRKLNIPCGGGTELSPAIETVSSKYDNIVVLTDGYCDKLKFNNKNMNILIYSRTKPSYTGKVHVFCCDD